MLYPEQHHLALQTGTLSEALVMRHPAATGKRANALNTARLLKSDFNRDTNLNSSTAPRRCWLADTTLIAPSLQAGSCS